MVFGVNISNQKVYKVIFYHWFFSLFTGSTYVCYDGYSKKYEGEWILLICNMLKLQGQKSEKGLVKVMVFLLGLMKRGFFRLL